MNQFPDFSRIYLQLQPDAAGIGHLTALQDTLPPQPTGRRLPPDELHMTVIHFGKINQVYQGVNQYQPTPRDKYLPALLRYVQSTEELVTDDIFNLQPIGFAGYGPRNNTLVVEYQPTPELSALHARAFVVLQKFFVDIGLKDVDGFIDNDPNFQYARAIKPHMTLYKSFIGQPPAEPLQPVNVSLMRVRY